MHNVLIFSLCTTAIDCIGHPESGFIKILVFGRNIFFVDSVRRDTNAGKGNIRSGRRSPRGAHCVRSARQLGWVAVEPSCLSGGSNPSDFYQPGSSG